MSRSGRPAAALPRGFTTVESMVALAVFMFGVLGVLHLNIMASNQNSLAQRESSASKIARDLVEAFERLPWDHAWLSKSSIDRASGDFLDVTKTGGLHSLDDATPSGRPLLGAADAIRTADGGGSVYKVYWRAAEQKGSDGVTVEGKWVAIMVRFRVPVVGTTKQLNFWTFKYNPGALTANQTNALVQEL